MIIKFKTNIDEAKQEVWPYLDTSRGDIRPHVGDLVWSTSGIRLEVHSVEIHPNKVEAELNLPRGGPWKNVAEFNQWKKERKNN